ncbi:MAG: hypothetical protein JXA89_12475 [Anaerolineae bacterium]|nr:hypothetical protein [Anaerolineae bacterium]
MGKTKNPELAWVARLSLVRDPVFIRQMSLVLVLPPPLKPRAQPTKRAQFVAIPLPAAARTRLANAL